MCTCVRYVRLVQRAMSSATYMCVWFVGVCNVLSQCAHVVCAPAHACVQLASILSTGTCKKLEGLDASCNEMGAIGASALAVALRTNHVLKTLDLSTNAIGDSGSVGFRV